MYSHSLTHTLSSLSLPLLLHLYSSIVVSIILSLQNGLTALEVARASTDKVWDGEKYWDDEHRQWRRRVVVHDVIIDLLSRYTAEPAVLPSHHVSGTITTSSH